METQARKTAATDVSETLSVLLLRFFPLSLTEEEGMRLVLAEQSAAGGFPWSLAHTVELLSLQAPLEIISHTQKALFPRLKKGTFWSIMSKFSAKFPETADHGCCVPVCCGSCAMIASCTRATVDVSMLSG